jgi:hypothetical protein
VTKWIRENIREAFAGHQHLWFMLCIGRVINWPDALADLIKAGAWPADGVDDFDPARIADVLDDRASHEMKCFTGAYTITAPPEKGAKKTTFVANVTLGNLWQKRARFERNPPRTMREFHMELTQFKAWGPFMAYQAIVDMRFTPILSGAADVASWAAAGPGTIRGLNRLHGRPLDFALPQDRALDEIRTIYALTKESTGVDVDFSDVPNMLCETDKLLRVRKGEGAPRALYVPGRGA